MILALVRMGVNTLRRLGETIRATERSPGPPPLAYRGRAEPPTRLPYPDQIVAIVLDEDIPEVHGTGDEYDGSIRGWDPSADTNKGDYGGGTTAVKLRDTLEMAIYGATGAKGVGRIKYDGNGKMFVELLGLICP